MAGHLQAALGERLCWESGEGAGTAARSRQRGGDPGSSSSGAPGCPRLSESQLGDWFLRTPGTIETNIEIKLIIDYTSTNRPVPAASGENWDLDGRSNGTAEQRRVQGFDGANVLLGTILSPIGTNNFRPTTVPEPPTAARSSL